MAYIHEKPGWPEFTWDDSTLASPLAGVRHKQGRLLGKMEGLGFELREEANLLALTTEVVTSSAIEGETLDTGEVRSSIARKLGLDVGGSSKVSRDVDGVVEMMLDATTNFAARLTKNRLFNWHSSLFPTGRNSFGKLAVGKWRSKEGDPMQVVSGLFGRQKVHFEAPTADRIDREMRQFLDWFNKPPDIDPVLKAGIAHLWFVTIHPLEDGNGRIARAIADMALARADGTPQRFYSMSSQIEVERKAYYSQLEAAQRGDVDITSWLAWFLDCFGRAIDRAEGTLAAVLFKARMWQRINVRPVNERQQLVLNRLLGDFQGFLTNAKYAKFAKCSPDTALRDIKELVDRGILLQNTGRGRSTSYRLATSQNVKV